MSTCHRLLIWASVAPNRHLGEGRFSFSRYGKHIHETPHSYPQNEFSYARVHPPNQPSEKLVEKLVITTLVPRAANGIWLYSFMYASHRVSIWIGREVPNKTPGRSQSASTYRTDNHAAPCTIPRVRLLSVWKTNAPTQSSCVTVWTTAIGPLFKRFKPQEGHRKYSRMIAVNVKSKITLR
jgi:hypothetical protein